MDDLSASHRNNWRIKPTLAYGCAVAQALAAMHAHWWGAEKLHSIDGMIPSQIEIERYVDRAQAGLLPMLENVKAEIDVSWKQALTDVFKYHPAKMAERAKNNSGFTLIHGDVNPGNILSPLDGDGKTYLIDRQPFDWSLTTWLGVSDQSVYDGALVGNRLAAAVGNPNLARVLRESSTQWRVRI